MKESMRARRVTKSG